MRLFHFILVLSAVVMDNLSNITPRLRDVSMEGGTVDLLAEVRPCSGQGVWPFSPLGMPCLRVEGTFRGGAVGRNRNLSYCPGTMKNGIGDPENPP